MKKSNELVYIRSSSTFDLFALLFQINNATFFEKDISLDLPSKELHEWMSSIRASLSPAFLDELYTFFHEDSFFGMTLLQLLYKNEQYQDIEKAIAYLETVEAPLLIGSFLRSGYSNIDTPSDLQESANVYTFIKQSALPSNEKSKLFYLYYDADETKERFIRLLKEGYEKLYQPNAAWFSRLQNEGIEMAKKLSEAELMKMADFELENPPKHMVMFPSHFYFTNSLFSYDSSSDVALFVFGIQKINNIAKESNIQEKITDFARALSDNKRISIITELNKTPRYGYELAQLLNLSSPTISHHMSILQRLDLVLAFKDENKIYYKVNKEKIHTSLQDIADLLT